MYLLVVSETESQEKKKKNKLYQGVKRPTIPLRIDSLADASDANLFALILSSSALFLASSAALDLIVSFTSTFVYCCKKKGIK